MQEIINHLLILDDKVRLDMNHFIKYNTSGLFKHNYYKTETYHHIFFTIDNGNIIYPKCYLYPNNKDINLYSSYFKHGYYFNIVYNIENNSYLFNCSLNENEPLYITTD